MKRASASTASKAGARKPQSAAGRGASRRTSAPVQARSTKSPVWESQFGPHIYEGQR